MEKVVRGKYLVRKTKLANGKDALVITGVFHPMNFDISEIKDNDEMWVSDLQVLQGGLRFTDPVNGIDVGSPEDFIGGSNQMPRDWQNKSKL